MTLVVLLDGTMSTLRPGRETSIGLIWKLLSEMAPTSDMAVYYEPGIQLARYSQMRDVIEGRGLNRQIQRAYGWLSSQYRPGDRIYFLGYSRGAYAVRSLAGVIGRIGLLRADAATERNVQNAYRHYRTLPDAHAADDFRRINCHNAVEVEMIGAFDTVKALGLGAPIIWRWSQMAHRFHDHTLNDTTKRGYHALAHDERRRAYRPVLWRTRDDWDGNLEQVWFPGTHGDVGGHLSGRNSARPLANVALCWMLGKAEQAGLPLPDGWRARFPVDPEAPSIGQYVGMGKFLRSREDRLIGTDPSEELHASVAKREVPLSGKWSIPWRIGGRRTRP
ncbi:hypothetical protein PARPLA_01826 [Rhodobacteraceae bacterium THAF1]|uniref:DUF2235 domain-containing protein n=1 Tax=Palleronia sp. THAF1 TaxID=2587842 RepID=UPI000F3B1A10|nr:DUF2235 domain-containing protein [Palleronia sp. THAF1]QFU09039.1 hypothetical protein FIU81_10170 [Palleronia sp. THAF1]VDC24184.1 hypothetical protein PARPLA_01826 [Rhodobacteraceae bacterium THAF1]